MLVQHLRVGGLLNPSRPVSLQFLGGRFLAFYPWRHLRSSLRAPPPCPRPAAPPPSCSLSRQVRLVRPSSVL